MDFLERLRMQRLYGGTPEQYQDVQPMVTDMPELSGPVMPPQDMEPQPFDVGGRMKELYQPETQAQDRFNSLIDSPPAYQNPSLLRTIAASLSAFGPGGHKTGSEVMNFHNNLNQADWERQIKPAQQAADNERASNVNSRTLAHQTVANELKARSDRDKNIIDTKNVAIREKRANVYDFKAKNPNMKFLFPPGGNIIAVDPTNPKRKQIVTDADGNPIPTGVLSDTDKINFKQDDAMEQIEARNQGALAVEDARQGGRETIAETRGWQLGSIPDPKDPSKQIGVQINQVTGEVKPIQFGDQNPVFTKPGTAKAGGTGPQEDAIKQKTQETLDALNEVLGKDDKLTPQALDAVGKSRMFGLQYLPGTQTRAGEASIKRLKSMLIVDLIGEMKAQSRTGATGFGQMNIKELAVLESAASKLDPALDEETFTNELKRIRDRLKKILQPADGMTDTRTVPKTKKTAAEMIKLYGG